VVDAIPIITGAVAADNPFRPADAAARSLNRTRLVELPGVAGVDDLLGHSASDLLSAATRLPCFALSTPPSTSHRPARRRWP
jgi:hypothetical protein